VRRHWVARTLVYTHRWLGIAGGALIFTWFASGIVMMYARMPALDPAERPSRLSPLDPSSIRVPPASIGPESTRLTISTLEGRPVFRVTSNGAPRTIFADTGEPLEPLSADRAVSIARAFVGGDGSAVRHDARLIDSDQWTFGVRGQMPVHRIALGDRDDTRLYISERSGEVVMKTTASGRRWGVLGAVFHWIYFTPFRRQAAAWSLTIIWLSIAGVVLSTTGLLWGLWRYSPAKRYRLKVRQYRSPYAGLMRWHHYAGLVFGITTITWIFSGLLSMDPWTWSPGTAPTRAQRDAVSHGPLRLGDVPLEKLQTALAAYGSGAQKEVDLLRFRGRYFLRAEAGIVSFDSPVRGPDASLPADEMLGAAREAMPGATIDGVFLMDQYDAYYYDRDGRLSLPVLRVRYGDPQQTWLYLDPKRGTIVRKEERLSRINRWLYHGLHSFDFPFLYYRRPLWDIVVISLSAGGMLLSATTMVAAWRRVRRRVRAIGPAS
jgi:hypothetical protein